MSKLFRTPSHRSEFGDTLADVALEAPATIRREHLRPSHVAGPLDKLMMGVVCCASVSFCAYAIIVSLNNPNYFSEKLISSLNTGRAELDPIMTGTVAAPAASGEAGLPVAVIARDPEPKPGDYQIVMVFDGEAILATNRELMRAKVGTVLPGLGAVKEITPNGTGGTVVAEQATLQTAP